MDALMAVKRGEEGAALPAPRERRVKAVGQPLSRIALRRVAPPIRCGGRHRRPDSAVLG
jgi:hypothetical protein